MIVGAVVSHADGYGERSAALAMLDTLPGMHRKTVGADKGYDTRDFITNCRKRGVAPHVASHTTRWGGSAVDGRTSRQAGYAASQIVRKRIQEHFAWGKTIGRIRQTVFPSSGAEARRPTVQAHHDGQQHRAHGSNTAHRTARSSALSNQVAPARRLTLTPRLARATLSAKHPLTA